MTYKCMLSSSAVQNFARLPGGITDISSFVILGSGIAFYWLSMIWGTGYFIENQRDAGTLELLFLTPTNRVTLLLSVALQDFVFSSVMVGITVSLCGIAFGLNLHIADPLGLAACFLLTVTALYSVGMFFASFFVLTRAANLLANFLQSPIMYLSGMNFPMDAIPKVLLFF